MSHGETLLPILNHMTKLENEVLFLDEPESGMSIKSQIKIAKLIEVAVKKNHQVFVCTHSPYIMRLHGNDTNVLSLDDKKWMSAHEFIKKQEKY